MNKYKKRMWKDKEFTEKAVCCKRRNIIKGKWQHALVILSETE